jgi:hypothetical protein
VVFSWPVAAQFDEFCAGTDSTLHINTAEQLVLGLGTVKFDGEVYVASSAAVAAPI